MSVTIVATVGSASANSFVTEAEFATYMASKLHGGGYYKAGEGSRKIALVEATRELSVLRYKGSRATSTQALPFPRQSLPVSDSPAGAYYSTSEVPQLVKDAQMELAHEFLRDEKVDVSVPDRKTPQLLSKQIGPDIKLTHSEGEVRPERGLARFPRVLSLLSPFLLSGYGQSRLVR